MSEVAKGGEEMVVEEVREARASVDTQGRRKRHRQRRKRKLGRPPYVPMRGKGSVTASVRAQEIRHEMFTHGQPVAPYNTTQFLIEDHGDLQNIDAQLNKPPDMHRHSRTRDSSFSIDSGDDDFFYSSPEDEEEFLTKEFSLEYQDLHVERLNSLSKADIIHDYLMLENKYEKSVGELRKLKADSGRDTDASSRSEVDIGEQLRLAQLENRRLKAELDKLKRENATLQSTARRGSSDSSVDSESDSTSSSSAADVSAPSSPQPAEIITEEPEFAVPETPPVGISAAHPIYADQDGDEQPENIPN